ncbi:uncharacterized protein K460DRAFT_290206 [Cucurbitaria berberidis CBS 394.84]|uniref:Uncharacterized protein n=1 Tax=Cucurbitaria berberidis CBS 394.84 TaxID=1168544 RepID=A0A9P4GBT4_9PLEO|nr:uncharacterized protein K460DRAFT_290206 [Cucurbitaria berberidis CBS 394.84]KAF1842656.1 hypothetical protein K460DRAFT_290206 [Cucurbitaria berberidis CBS 394.84]
MVYITSDLFGPTIPHDRQEHNLASTYWPATANVQHTAALGKRRRHDGDDGPTNYQHQHQHQHQHRLLPMNRDAGRSQSTDTPPVGRNNHSSYTLFSAASERRPVKQLKRLTPKAMLVKSTSHLMDIESELPPTAQVTDAEAHAVSDLRPCHACSLAPKRKKDLVNYLDCKRCNGRTCYVCARECVGGCGKAVCKKCIVEVGQEGDSWCLDCYSRHINS